MSYFKKNGSIGWTDRQTDGRGATLNEVHREPAQASNGQ